MKRKFISLLAAGALAMPVSTVLADTLDFTEIGTTGLVPATVINLSNAVLTSFGDDMFVGAPFAFGESNGKGIVCASPVGNGTCEEDLQIAFNAAVSNLTFGSFGVSQGDLVTVSAFLGATLLGSAVVTTSTTVDFSALGAIDRLFFADASTAAGIGWGDFLFTVPEPAPLALLGLGLLGLAISRRRKT